MNVMTNKSDEKISVVEHRHSAEEYLKMSHEISFRAAIRIYLRITMGFSHKGLAAALAFFMLTLFVAPNANADWQVIKTITATGSQPVVPVQKATGSVLSGTWVDLYDLTWPFGLAGGEVHNTTPGATPSPGSYFSDLSLSCSGTMQIVLYWVPDFPGEPCPDSLTIDVQTMCAIWGAPNPTGMAIEFYVTPFDLPVVDDGMGDPSAFNLARGEFESKGSHLSTQKVNKLKSPETYTPPSGTVGGPAPFQYYGSITLPPINFSWNGNLDLVPPGYLLPATFFDDVSGDDRRLFINSPQTFHKAAYTAANLKANPNAKVVYYEPSTNTGPAGLRIPNTFDSSGTMQGDFGLDWGARNTSQVVPGVDTQDISYGVLALGSWATAGSQVTWTASTGSTTVSGSQSLGSATDSIDPIVVTYQNPQLDPYGGFTIYPNAPKPWPGSILSNDAGKVSNISVTYTNGNNGNNGYATGNDGDGASETAKYAMALHLPEEAPYKIACPMPSTYAQVHYQPLTIKGDQSDLSLMYEGDDKTISFLTGAAQTPDGLQPTDAAGVALGAISLATAEFPYISAACSLAGIVINVVSNQPEVAVDTINVKDITEGYGEKWTDAWANTTFKGSIFPPNVYTVNNVTTNFPPFAWSTAHYNPLIPNVTVAPIPYAIYTDNWSADDYYSADGYDKSVATNLAKRTGTFMAYAFTVTADPDRKP
jgi:hypothetical protein